MKTHKLVLISDSSAHWLGMAPSVAGGWVMADQARYQRINDVMRRAGLEHSRIACVPSDWAGYSEASSDLVSSIRDALDREQVLPAWLQKKEWAVEQAEAAREWARRIDAIFA